MKAMSNQTCVIVITEDSEHDMIAMKRAWKMGNFTNLLHLGRNGKECLGSVFQRGHDLEPCRAPRPRSLLPDINMPIGFQQVAEALQTLHPFWQIVEFPEVYHGTP